MQESDDKMMLLVGHAEGSRRVWFCLTALLAEYFLDRTMHEWEEACRRFGETYCPHLQWQVCSRRKKNTQTCEKLEDGGYYDISKRQHSIVLWATTRSFRTESLSI